MFLWFYRWVAVWGLLKSLFKFLLFFTFYSSSYLIICTITFWLLSSLLLSYTIFYYKCSRIFKDYESLIYFSANSLLESDYFYFNALSNCSMNDYFNFNVFSVLFRLSLYSAVFSFVSANYDWRDCNYSNFKFVYLFAWEVYFVNVALNASNYAIRVWSTCFILNYYFNCLSCWIPTLIFRKTKWMVMDILVSQLIFVNLALIINFVAKFLSGYSYRIRKNILFRERHILLISSVVSVHKWFKFLYLTIYS